MKRPSLPGHLASRLALPVSPPALPTSPLALLTSPLALLASPLALLASLLTLLATPLALAAPVSAAQPRTSLPVIERQVMCVTCKIPLNVAESQQADRERAFIQGLIDQGQGEAEIKDALVGQYGPAVLGLPSTKGFDLTAYLVPLAAVLGLLGLLAFLLPRWRRKPPGGSGGGASAALTPADAARLESDLARFD